MKTLDTRPATVSALADIVTAYYEKFDTFSPPTETYDAVARALGVAPTCTGNSDTAAESVTHTPKAGLSVAFYSVGATHRAESPDRPLTAYYVATWKGEKYRGNVILSRQGYHRDTPNGFHCYDQAPYSDVLPVGCRTLVADLVTKAVIDSAIDMDHLCREWADSGTYYEISSHIHKAKMALEDAARVQNRGR